MEDAMRFCCDQLCKQGRECPLVAPAPAEACTEVGADDPPHHSVMRVVLCDLLVAVAIIGTVFLILWGALG